MLAVVSSLFVPKISSSGSDCGEPGSLDGEGKLRRRGSMVFRSMENSGCGGGKETRERGEGRVGVVEF